MTLAIRGLLSHSEQSHMCQEFLWLTANSSAVGRGVRMEGWRMEERALCTASVRPQAEKPSCAQVLELSPRLLPDGSQRPGSVPPQQKDTESLVFFKMFCSK